MFAALIENNSAAAAYHGDGKLLVGPFETREEMDQILDETELDEGETVTHFTLTEIE